MLTLSKTQRENGKVTTTISQEMQKRTHPRNPSPVCLDLVTELAAQNINQIMLGIIISSSQVNLLSMASSSNMLPGIYKLYFD